MRVEGNILMAEKKKSNAAEATAVESQTETTMAYSTATPAPVPTLETDPATSAVPAPAPKKPRGPKPGCKRISGFDIDDATYHRIDEIARREFRTPSMQVQKLIREGLKFEEQQ
jgi:uncharacterized membrane protein